MFASLTTQRIYALGMLLFIPLFTPLFIYGQQLHSPDELAAIMKKSFIYYDLKEDKNIANDKTLKVLEENYYFEEEEDSIVLKQYDMMSDERFAKKYQKAKRYAAAGKTARARKTLEKLIEKHPKNAILMTDLARTFFIEKEFIQAIKWVKRAIRTNGIHTPAYVLLTQIYMTSNKYEEAVASITKAHLLNRNSTFITQLLQQVYEANQRVYDNSWQFIEQYEIKRVAENEVSVVYNGEPWRAYAACRAIWAHEPYYQDGMKPMNDDLYSLREHECLLNMAIAYEKWDDEKRKKKFNMGITLQRAIIQEKMVDEFILYEIKLVQNPKMGFYFSDKDIQKLAAYMVAVRSLEIPLNKSIPDN